MTLANVMATALLAGVLSLPHCAAMCGPLAMASCASAGGSVGRGAHYLLGRLVGYGTVGALLGALGDRGSAHASLASLQNVAMALLVLWCGYRAYRAIAAYPRAMAGAGGLLQWRARPSSTEVAAGSGSGLLQLRARPPRTEAATSSGGGLLQVHARPPSAEVTAGSGGGLLRLLRLLQLRPQSALGMGLVTAVLPCSALVGAWLLAAATAEPLLGSASMMAFALASSPALVGAIAGHQLIRGSLRRIPPLAAVLGWLALALLLLARWWMSSGGHSCHG